MWTHRNGFKHGSTGPNQQQLKERLQEEIEEEYEQGTDNLLPCDQHWLKKSLAELQLNPAIQQQWLTSVPDAHDQYHN